MVSLVVQLVWDDGLSDECLVLRDGLHRLLYVVADLVNHGLEVYLGVRRVDMRITVHLGILLFVFLSRNVPPR